MPTYYLDFETTGINPSIAKIITIQYQKIDQETGEPIGPLVILKEWESSEKEILNEFLSDFGFPNKPWNFIPIGFNLRFEFYFLLVRAKEVLGIGIPIKWLYFHKPFVDIKSTVVMVNKGQFKGAKLSWFTDKKEHGSNIPNWYLQKQFHEIEDYIMVEAREFIKAYQFLLQHLPILFEKYKRGRS